MYVPEDFREHDAARIEALLRAFPFSLLITVRAGGPLVTHLPLVLETLPDGQTRLDGHLAKANPQARELGTGGEALAVFTGPHGYISPRGYERPGVPTWNYAAVHVSGRVEAVTKRKALSQLIGRMTRRFEGDASDAWDWPQNAGRFEGMLEHIVGFHLYAERIEAKFKLGQNRAKSDRAGAAHRLASTDDSVAQALADLMRGV